jgi:hypothetical protein
MGLSRRSIDRRLDSGRLRRVHQGVYELGRARLDRRGRWLAAVLAYGPDSVLSHRSAAVLWGLRRSRGAAVDVTSRHGRAGRPGVALHECRLDPEDLAEVASIPTTTVARTLFDLAEVVPFSQLQSACEEADRLGLLELKALERVVERGWGRHALRPIRPILVEARAPSATRSALESRFLAFCQTNGLPAPATNVLVGGREVDALWPKQQLIVELDGFAYHGHRAAFERDRARDAAFLAAGYLILRLTHRRLVSDGPAVAAQLRHMLGRA